MAHIVSRVQTLIQIIQARKDQFAARLVQFIRGNTPRGQTLALLHQLKFSGTWIGATTSTNAGSNVAVGYGLLEQRLPNQSIKEKHNIINLRAVKKTAFQTWVLDVHQNETLAGLLLVMLRRLDYQQWPFQCQRPRSAAVAVRHAVSD